MPVRERLRWQKSAETSTEWEVVGLVAEEVEEAADHVKHTTAGSRKPAGRQPPRKMAFESINVRMTRSNPQIPWGFELQQRAGNELYVAKLESGSMAEKAGIQQNDLLNEILNQRNLTLKLANDRLRSALEITMVLRRPVNDSPSLPWALKEQGGGRLLVEQNTQQRGGGGQQVGYQGPVSNGAGVDEIERRRFQRNITETRAVGELPPGVQQSKQQQAGGEVNFDQLPYNTTTHKAEGNSSWDREDGGVHRHYESKRSYTRTESSSVPPGGLGGQQTNGLVQNYPPTTQSYGGESVLYRHHTGDEQRAAAGGQHVQQSIGGRQETTRAVSGGGGGGYTQTQHQTQSRAVPGGVQYVTKTTTTTTSSSNGIPQPGGQQYGGQVHQTGGSQTTEYSTRTSSNQQQQQFGGQQQRGGGQQQSYSSSSTTAAYPRFPQNQYNQGVPENHYEEHKRIAGVAGGVRSVDAARFAPGQPPANAPNAFTYTSGQQQQQTQGQQSAYTQQTTQRPQPPPHQQFGVQHRRDGSSGGYQLQQQAYTKQPAEFVSGQGQQQTQSNVQSGGHSTQFFQQQPTAPSQQQQATGGQFRGANEREISIYDATGASYEQQQPTGGFERASRSRDVGNFRTGRPPFDQQGGGGEGRLVPPLQHRSAYTSPQRSRSQPYGRAQAATPKPAPGPPVYYIPPHPRTYRELSPSASVLHLQYNSPLQLYSPEAAAEAYRQQTGQELSFYPEGPGLAPHRPAYLDSETRRLIAEEERGGRIRQSMSPIQSGAMRRIAAGVGVPLD
ncbi:ZM domain-containing protein [Aphelenchoides fujianensis]|nr:ZM domain-containing protein [Aphelenchoides fujianensis]